MNAGVGGWEQHAWIINLSYDFYLRFLALIISSQFFKSIDFNFKYFPQCLKKFSELETNNPACSMCKHNLL